MATIGRIIPWECDIEWRIEDFFSYAEKKNERYSSPLFFFAGSDWYLRIYPNGNTKKNIEEYISLYLRRKFPGPPIGIEYSFGLKNLDEERENEIYGSSIFKDETIGYGIPKFILVNELRQKKADLLPFDALSVLCTLKHHHSIENVGGATTKICSHCKETFDALNISSHEKKCLIKCPKCSAIVVLQSWYDHECQIAEVEGEKSISSSAVLPHSNKILLDFKELYRKQEDCDVIIRVKEQEFPAHRIILKARSPVFASIFQTDMKEKTTGIVDIEDCDPSIFSDFLCFLYCDNVDNLSQGNVFNLFTAADKYDVSDLRVKCMEFVKENLCVDSFCDTITLALRHSETELISLTTDFFIKNASKIIENVKWQSFLIENPIQSNELFVKLLASNKSND